MAKKRFSSAEKSSGTYTPTLTITENLTTATLVGVGMWRKDGDRVIVRVILTLAPTTINVDSALSITLPIPTNIVNNYDLIGVCSSKSASGYIEGGTVTEQANIRINTADSASRSWAVNFEYIIK